MGFELGREVGDDGCMGGIMLGDAGGGRLAVASQILALPAPWVLQRRGQGENWRAQKGNWHPHPVAVGEASALAGIFPLGLSIILLGKTASSSASPCGKGEKHPPTLPSTTWSGCAHPYGSLGARDPCPYLHPGFGQVRP